MSARFADEADAALAELPIGSPVTPPASPSAGAGTPAARQGLFRRKGHAQTARPDPAWVRTDERFRDPSSNTIMRVWLDPADGSRHYVPDDGHGR